MTFLEITQALQQECGVAGTLSSVTTTTANLARLVAWSNRAWVEIQNRHKDWEFMRSSVLRGAGASFATVGSQATYALGSAGGTTGVTAAVFGRWDEWSFRLYTTATGVADEQQLAFRDYDTWRDGYMLGNQQNSPTRPCIVSVAPDKAVCLGPPPTAGFTVTADYWRKATQMAGDDSEPTGLPEEFHMLIVYRAMIKYGFFFLANEVIQRAQFEHNSMMASLEHDYMPRISFAGALA